MSDALILQLDASGAPQAWVGWQDAVIYHAKEMVAWSLGEIEFTFHGGKNKNSGEQSVITTASIIAVKGHSGSKAAKYKIPALSNKTLFRRDKNLCAYCGNHFSYDDLSCDHIQPVSRGGKNVWQNVVSACKPCNQRKNDQTPEEAHMQLLYVPYVPTKYEAMILNNRKILADQMEFLMAHVPKNSRLWSA